MGSSVSGVGVIDKAMAVLDALEESPRSLGELVAATGFSRATAHRLAVALEVHGLVRRDDEGRFALGVRLIALGRAAAEAIPLAEAALPALAALRDETGESVQLYVREGDRRVCIAALESPHGLRTIVPMGASLPLDVGIGRAHPAAPSGPARAAPESRRRIGTESAAMGRERGGAGGRGGVGERRRARRRRRAGGRGERVGADRADDPPTRRALRRGGRGGGPSHRAGGRAPSGVSPSAPNRSDSVPKGGRRERSGGRSVRRRPGPTRLGRAPLPSAPA